MTAGEQIASPTPRLSLRGLIARLAWAASDLYVLGVLGFLGIRLGAGEGWWVVALLNNMVQWLLLPPWLVLAAALWRRRWRRAILYGAPVAIFLALYGELFLPGLRAARACAAGQPTCTTPLRVMQFNLYNDHIDTARLIPMVRASGADVIAFEELSLGPAAALRAQLSDLYPYQVQFGDGIPGVGLISKYPITSAELFSFDEKPYLFHVRAVLDVNGAPLRMIVAHPVPPAWEWAGRTPRYTVRNGADLRGLAHEATSGGPALMIGDFNTTDQSDDYRMLRDAGLRDAFRDAGWGFGVTWPLRGGFLRFTPLVRIDYIWMTSDFSAVNAWVGGDAGSDHLPVLADLVWQR